MDKKDIDSTKLSAVTAQNTKNERKKRKKLRLNRKKIKYHNYTITLLDEALRCGYITEIEGSRIKAGITDALEEAVKTYTGNESTSVMKETANSLLKSVLFAIDAYLLGINDDRKAIDVIKTNKIPKLYDLGMKQLKLLCYETLSLLAKARSNRIVTPNEAYNKLIDHDITDFLKSYNIATNAHVNSIFDYKTALPVTNYRGIYCVKMIIYYLYCENSFCASFDPNELNRLYQRWCDQNNEEYGAAKVNIYALTYTNALLCDYLKKEHGTLTLTYEDCDLVCRIMDDFKISEIANILRTTSSHIVDGDAEYNSKALEKFIPRLARAIASGQLASIIPIDTGNENTNQ